MTEEQQHKPKKHSPKSFLTGMVMGAAILLGAYFTYLLVTNDEQETISMQNASMPKDSIPPLYYLIGIPKVLFDSSLQALDSIYYRNKWNQLISMAGYREMDSLFIDSVIRKMYFDSLMVNAEINEDTIILQNDKLIASKNIVVTVQKALLITDDTAKKNNYIYSDAHYKFEFWESPIKYRGSKRNGNHVVLYGLSPKIVNTFAQIENDLYIRENQLWYIIPNTSEFRGFSPVTSQQMLIRLDYACRHK